MSGRLPVSALALLFCALLATNLLAQSSSQSTSSSPASPQSASKWGPAPLRGEGTIEVIRGTARRVGDDVVTTLKIKNTSPAALSLLVVDEYWYSATSKDPISGDTQRYRGRIEPGQVVEITTKSPWRAEMNRNQFMFRHANGTIKAKAVKKFSTDDDK